MRRQLHKLSRPGEPSTPLGGASARECQVSDTNSPRPVPQPGSSRPEPGVGSVAPSQMCSLFPQRSKLLLRGSSELLLFSISKGICLVLRCNNSTLDSDQVQQVLRSLSSSLWTQKQKPRALLPRGASLLGACLSRTLISRSAMRDDGHPGHGSIPKRPQYRRSNRGTFTPTASAEGSGCSPGKRMRQTR